MKVKRVGILGGSFDPVHTFHLEMARFCLHKKDVDEVWVCPSYHHTQKNNIASFEDRIEMCDMMFKRWFTPIKVMDVEKFNDNGSSYNLLRNLRILVNGRCTFSFIIGQDQADNIHTWYKYEDLLEMDLPFIVFGRKSYDNKPPTPLTEEYWFDKDSEDNWYKNKHSGHHFYETINSVTSSTFIRKCIEKKHWDIVESLTNKKISKFINKKGLYK